MQPEKSHEVDGCSCFGNLEQAPVLEKRPENTGDSHKPGDIRVVELNGWKLLDMTTGEGRAFDARWRGRRRRACHECTRVHIVVAKRKEVIFDAQTKTSGFSATDHPS